MPRLVGPPIRVPNPDPEVPYHNTSCLSPDGRWLAMIGGGSHMQVTMYDLEVVSPPRREAWYHEDRTARETTMAGTPDHGLLAVVDISYRETNKPRHEQQGAQLSWRALPGGAPLELTLDGLPEGWFELVDEMHAPIGFEDPVIVVSTPIGGMLVRFGEAGLVASTAQTCGRLLTAHPDAGLVVSTSAGLCIETSDGHLTSLPHDRPALDERFAFSVDGRRAVWLRDRLLTALRLDDESGWTAIATRELPDDHEVLGLAASALLWRRASDGQLGVTRWGRPLEPLHEASLPSGVDAAELSAAGNAVVLVTLADGRLQVCGADGDDRLTLEPLNMNTTERDPQRLFLSTTAGCSRSPDGRVAVVNAWHHFYDPPDDPTRHASSLTLWDAGLMRPVQTLVERTPQRFMHGWGQWSDRGALVVVHEDHLAFWSRDGDAMRLDREVALAELDGAPLIAQWLTPDTLAVTSLHNDRDDALLFDDRGNRRTPDHFGLWGFQIPHVGRFSATGRRIESVDGYRTAVAGRDGLITIEARPSTWAGAERGAQTTVLAYRQAAAGVELTAIELAVPTRGSFYPTWTLDGGRHVLMRRDSRHWRGWLVLRVDEDPLQLELVGQFEASYNMAISPAHPWMLTVGGGDERNEVDVRHVADPTTVVDRLSVPAGAGTVRLLDRGETLQVDYPDGAAFQWRLELD